MNASTSALNSARRMAAVATCLVAIVAVMSGPAAAHPRSSTGRYDNCTALNRSWPHGVGKANAHDHTTGTPVTSFKRSDHLYRVAMNHNSGLDRDKDHIACEKA